MEQEPNYYAIIPATVRYDRTLPPAAKLLYGEITALANKKGYCWAGNAYFAELYDVTKKTVSEWVSKLSQAGHIVVEIDRANGNIRYITLPRFSGIGIPENRDTYTEKTVEVSRKNGIAIPIFREHNNTDNNTSNKQQPKTKKNGSTPVVVDEVKAKEKLLAQLVKEGVFDTVEAKRKNPPTPPCPPLTVPSDCNQIGRVERFRDEFTEPDAEPQQAVEDAAFALTSERVNALRDKILQGRQKKETTCMQLKIRPDQYDQFVNGFFDEEIAEMESGQPMRTETALRSHLKNWINIQVRLGAESRYHPSYTPPTQDKSTVTTGNQRTETTPEQQAENQRKAAERVAMRKSKNKNHVQT